MSAAPTPRLRKVLPEQGWTPSYWAVSQNRELSFRALGLHTYLMSMPEGWRISSDRVAAKSLEGRDSVQTALRELEAANLYKVVRTRGPGGKFVTYGVVYAVPTETQPDEGQAEDDASDDGETEDAYSDYPSNEPERENPAPDAYGDSDVATYSGGPSNERDDATYSDNQGRVDRAPENPAVKEERLKEDIGAAGPKASRKRAETDVPDIFPVTDAMREYAARKGVTGTAVDEETERFLLSHRAKGTRFRDWNAAWRTWISRVKTYAPAQNGSRRAQARSIGDVPFWEM